MTAPVTNSIVDPYTSARAIRDDSIRAMEELCVNAIASIIRVPIQAAAIQNGTGIRIEVRFRAGTPLATVIDLADLAQAQGSHPDPINKLFGIEADPAAITQRAADLLLHLTRLAVDLQVLGQRLARYTPRDFVDP